MTVEQMAYFYKELAEVLLEYLDDTLKPYEVRELLEGAGYSKNELEYLGYFEEEED